MRANGFAAVVFSTLALSPSAIEAQPVAGASPRQNSDWQLLLSTTARPATWAARRQEFARAAREASQSPSSLETIYEDERAALETERRYARAMPRNVKTVGRGCVGSALRDCKVLGTGQLKLPDGQQIAWQTQRGFTPEDGVRGGVVLLEQKPGHYSVIAWSFEGYYWERPVLIARKGQTLLTVAGRMAGTGSLNADLLYRRDGQTWREIEPESWKRDIPGRLPKDFGVWKGVDYDFTAMTARMRVWKPSDANCCPSVGQAIAALQIRGNSLTMTGLRYRRPQ